MSCACFTQKSLHISSSRSQSCRNLGREQIFGFIGYFVTLYSQSLASPARMNHAASCYTFSLIFKSSKCSQLYLSRILPAQSHLSIWFLLSWTLLSLQIPSLPPAWPSPCSPHLASPPISSPAAHFPQLAVSIYTSILSLVPCRLLSCVQSCCVPVSAWPAWVWLANYLVLWPYCLFWPSKLNFIVHCLSLALGLTWSVTVCETFKGKKKNA